jgi:hypothetical protein
MDIQKVKQISKNFSDATCRLRVLENRMFKRIFGSKRNVITGRGEIFIMKSLMICTPLPILCG